MEKLVPANASMSSVYFIDHSAGQCTKEGGICMTQGETAPWLALDYGGEVNVSRVVLINRNDSWAARTKNVNIRVSSTLPVSGREMFTGGQLLGLFEGPGTEGQRVEVTGGTQLTGRYVVVQMNFSSAANNLNLQEVTALSKGRFFFSLTKD